jgi:hypothetical protein
LRWPEWFKIAALTSTAIANFTTTLPARLPSGMKIEEEDQEELTPDANMLVASTLTPCLHPLDAHRDSPNNMTHICMCLWGPTTQQPVPAGGPVHQAWNETFIANRLLRPALLSPNQILSLDGVDSVWVTSRTQQLHILMSTRAGLTLKPTTLAVRGPGRLAGPRLTQK